MENTKIRMSKEKTTFNISFGHGSMSLSLQNGMDSEKAADQLKKMADYLEMVPEDCNIIVS